MWVMSEACSAGRLMKCSARERERGEEGGGGDYWEGCTWVRFWVLGSGFYESKVTGVDGLIVFSRGGEGGFRFQGELGVREWGVP